MSTTAIGSTTSATAAAATTATSNTELDKDAFLQLLVTQLQNQNPLNPQDSTEFMSQMAELSSLEQLQNMNSGIEDLSSLQAASLNTQNVEMVGKTVRYKGDEVTIKEGEPLKLRYDLAAEADKVTVTVKNSAGGIEATVSLSGHDKGQNDVTLDDLGLEAGSYTVEYSASDEAGENVGVTSYGIGRVTGVTFANNQTLLMVGNQTISPGNVTEVLE